MPFKTTLFLLLLLPALAHSQQSTVVREPKFITRFPFHQYNGGVMVIRATFENIKDSFNFILDTGSGGISLDSATCTNFNIPSRVTDTTISGIGGKRKVNFVFDKTLHFPGLDLNKLNFHINDYEVLTSVYGDKIDGIIGYSFFRRYIVKINFDSNFIEVFEPGKMNYPRGGTLLKPAFSSLPIQYLQFRDRTKMNHNFYFDTGAGLCLLLNDKYVKDSSVLLSKRKPVITQAEGMVGKLQMSLTVVKEVKLGPYRFYNVPTYLYKDDYNVINYPFAGGLIGNELLRRFNMTINYGQREIHLLPNHRFDEQFDYAYTGLGIYKTDGRVMVEDVIENSPGDKAGFLVGDELIAVGNNMSKNIQQYKNLLLVPNVRIRVVILREDKLKELHIKTGSIL
ncbi:MAG: signal protein PDZ [Sphingobacteriaceae bacterium]|nr:MAG: signal protein PDZ [Sphingobacteriaceae bacterium]